MEGDSELYYQTAFGGVTFQAHEPDPEDVGLDGYHRNERKAVLDFVKGTGGILVMGGITGTGKTHFLELLAKSSGFDYLDMHQLEEVFSMRGVERFLRRATLNSEVLIIDEGLKMISYGALVESAVPTLQKLFERYSHIVVAGGGEFATSGEQTDLLAYPLSEHFEVSAHSFPLKILNRRQVADLIAGRLNYEVARVAAEMLAKYFSLFWGAVRFRNWCQYENLDNVGHLRSSFHLSLGQLMPESCFKAAWKEQEKTLIEGKDELKGVIAQNGLEK